MNSAYLQDKKINVKIILAALWAAHFLLWTFGDMLSLLQQLNDPVDDELLLFVAVPLAIIQTLMIVFSLTGKPGVMRWVNMIVVLVFVVFNLGYLAEADAGWQFLLGAAYLVFNALIAFYAWTWPRAEAA